MLGNQLAAGQALTVANDSFNGDGSTVAFTLSQTVSSVNDIEVLVDNVQQSPYDSSYSVSGTTLTFSGAPSAGTNNVYVIYNASRHIATSQVIPDDGSVHSSKIASNAVTDAKIAAVATSKLTGDIPYANMPAGTVVQFKHSIYAGAWSNTSFNGSSGTGGQLYGANRGGLTYVEARSIVITPTSTSNILYCVCVTGWTSMAPTVTMAHGSIITRNDSTDSIDNADYPWYPHNQLISAGTYFPAETVTGIFTGFPAGAQTIRLRPYIYMEGAGGTGTASFGDSSLFIMEIKQ